MFNLNEFKPNQIEFTWVWLDSLRLSRTQVCRSSTLIWLKSNPSLNQLVLSRVQTQIWYIYSIESNLNSDRLQPYFDKLDISNKASKRIQALNMAANTPFCSFIRMYMTMWMLITIH